jgi:hypothetical protein
VATFEPAHTRGRPGWSDAVERTRSLLAVAAALLVAAAPAATRGAEADRCACTPGSPGLLWRGARPPPPEAVAALAAPVLWFSRDEPLLQDGGPIPPDPHPCDAPADRPVVYWALDRIRQAGDDAIPEPADEDPQLLERTAGVVLRYFFYYRADTGVGTHPHDIEVLDVELATERDGAGCHVVRVVALTGLAHGVAWYSNELRAARDLRLPPVVLVEEGKHASCPDRNADGMYTPGYDVNRRVNDAWGVRDVLGSGFLGGSAYQASMTKGRDRAHRVLPPESGPSCAVGRASSIPDPGRSLARYALRRARTVAACPEAPSAAELRESMVLNGFGMGREPPRRRYEIEDALDAPLTGTSALIPAVAARWDRHLGFAFMLRGLDLRELYVVPRFTVVRKDFSAEALLTDSAARFLSGYLSAGAVSEVRDVGRRWDFAAEAGVKARFTASGWLRILTIGYPFGGVRVGLRTTGFDDLTDQRFVVEFGAGVW